MSVADSASERHRAAVAAYRGGDHALALELFRQATADARGGARSWWWRARAAVAAGRTDEAYDAARRAGSLDPTLRGTQLLVDAALRAKHAPIAPRYWRDGGGGRSGVDEAGHVIAPRKAPTSDVPVVTRSLYTGDSLPRLDVDLLDRLNEEYRDKPIVPAPAAVDARSRSRKATQRLEGIDRRIGLRGRRVLEIGCAAGLEVWHLASDFGCDAYGVDVNEYSSWADLRAPGVSFTMADITAGDDLPRDFFDRIISFSVWEHVARPVEMLHEVRRLLRPGGVAQIFAMLYRSAIGSHLYRDIYFPWPHLLFSGDVISDWYVSRGKPPRRASWCNEMTWAQYEDAIVDLGFEVLAVKLDRRPLDEDFLQRFAGELGRYPRDDLATSAFTVTLRRPV